MVDALSTRRILEFHPVLGACGNPRLLGELEPASRLFEAEPGDSVFVENEPCESYLLLVEGSIRVYKVSGNGRELTLYRLSNRVSCALTTACLLSRQPYPASALAESAVCALYISRSDFLEFLDRYPEFRSFVFDAYGGQIGRILSVVSDIAFERLNCRLAQTLLMHAGQSDVVNMTHQEIAAELGSVREVVSRELQDFRRRGWVRLGRGQIVILNRGALAGNALNELPLG